MAVYGIDSPRRRGLRGLARHGVIILLLLAFVCVAAGLAVRHFYAENLGPVSSSTVEVVVVIPSDASVAEIAAALKAQGVIRQPWAFERYVRTTGIATQLQAGTYRFSPSMTVAQIARQIADGNVAIDLLTIVPGSRLSQIRQAFIHAKFDPAAVDAALEPSQYAGHPALEGKPAGTSLEGYLYPDSYQKSASTDPRVIVRQSLDEMAEHLTPDLRAAYAQRGLSTYQAITLASIVEQEVSRQSDRAQAAQVFLKRISVDMPLGSDVTAFYGALQAGRSPSVSYDSPYNTRIYHGLPPGPISAVSDSSLQAVAHPAATDWLYFVAGDDGITYFSKTNAEHEALTRQHCQKLCNSGN